jgi:hypothetical protein
MLGMFSLFCPLPCLRGMLEFAPSVSNVLIILCTSILYGQTRALHEDMEVEKIMRTLLTLETNSNTPRRHGSVHFHVFVECSSLSLVLVMFSLFCPLPCLRGVLEFARRHGSGQNNEYITNTRGKLEHSTKTWKWTK